MASFKRQYKKEVKKKNNMKWKIGRDELWFFFSHCCVVRFTVCSGYLLWVVDTRGKTGAEEKEMEEKVTPTKLQPAGA